MVDQVILYSFPLLSLFLSLPPSLPPSLSPSLPPPLLLLLSPGPVSGLNEEDLRASLATVEALASACGADLCVLRERQGEEGRMADCLVRRRVNEDDFMEVWYIPSS